MGQVEAILTELVAAVAVLVLLVLMREQVRDLMVVLVALEQILLCLDQTLLILAAVGALVDMWHLYLHLEALVGVVQEVVVTLLLWEQEVAAVAAVLIKVEVLVVQVLLFSNGHKKCQSLHRLAQPQFVRMVL